MNPREKPRGVLQMKFYFIKAGLSVYNVLNFIVVTTTSILFNGFLVPSRWKKPVFWRDEEGLGVPTREKRTNPERVTNRRRAPSEGSPSSSQVVCR